MATKKTSASAAATAQPETDTPEQRGAAYTVLAALTKAERDEIRAALCGPGQGAPAITVGTGDGNGIGLDAAACRTVLDGNRRERYLAIFPNHWGHGATVQEAITNARKNGARGNDYTVDEHDLATYGAHVDGMGCTGFFWALDADRSRRPVRVVSSGKAKAKGKRVA